MKTFRNHHKKYGKKNSNGFSAKYSTSVVKKQQPKAMKGVLAVQPRLHPADRPNFRPSSFATSIASLDKHLAKIHAYAEKSFIHAGGFFAFNVDGIEYYQAGKFFTKCRQTAFYLIRNYA